MKLDDDAVSQTEKRVAGVNNGERQVGFWTEVLKVGIKLEGQQQPKLRY